MIDTNMNFYFSFNFNILLNCVLYIKLKFALCIILLHSKIINRKYFDSNLIVDRLYDLFKII